MRLHLQKQLLQFAPLEHIIEIKLDAEAIEAINHEGLTPLQIITYDGRLDLMLWFLNQGARIKPIPREIAQEQPIAAALLAACYPQKHQSGLDKPPVSLAVYCYAQWKNADTLKTRVLPNLSNISQLELPTLSDRQKSAYYDFAVLGAANVVRIACAKDMKNYALIFQYGFLSLSAQFQSEKHLKALKTILEACDHPEDLLRALLIEKFNNAALFLIIASGLDVYKYALSIQQEEILLKKFIELVSSPAGFLRSLILRSLCEKPNQEILSLIKRMGRNNKQNIIRIFEAVMQQRLNLKFSLAEPDQLLYENYCLVKKYAGRLDIPTPLRQGEIELYFDREVTKIILDYVIHEKEEKVYDSTQEQSLREEKIKAEQQAAKERAQDRQLLSTIPNIQILIEELKQQSSKKCISYKTEQSMEHLQQEIDLLDHFIKTADAEIHSKKPCDHITQIFPWPAWTALALSFIGIVISSGLLIAAVNGNRDLQGKNGDPFSAYLAIPLTIFSFSFFALSFPLVISYCYQNPQRFSNLPISSLKNPTRTAAAGLFNHFNYKLAALNPFKDHDVESKIDDVLSIAKQELPIKRALLNSLWGNAYTSEAPDETDTKAEEEQWERMLPNPDTEVKSPLLQISIRS